jgi:dephospho-CoA kinase
VSTRRKSPAGCSRIPKIGAPWKPRSTRRRFQDFAAAATVPAVLEATLLVEAGYAPGFDRIVTVEADPALRLQRAIDRGLSEADARARLEAQGDGTVRRAAAHRVIDNSGDLAALRRQVDALIAEMPR